MKWLILIIFSITICSLPIIHKTVDPGFYCRKHLKSETKDYKKIIKYCGKAAERGNVFAQGILGLLYYGGKGVNQNYEEALKWFSKSAEQGNDIAQLYLGNMYYKGEGVNQNYDEALKWFSKAAEKGNADAQNMLGVMYYEGEGVNKNYYEALKWYSKAAEQGNAKAQSNLGMMYYRGEGVNQNYEEALKWVSTAAEQGNVNAQHMLGIMYYEGNGVNQSYGEDENLYRNNANQTAATQYSNAGQYKVGDKITFGSYPFYEDGSEKEIDWIILDIDADGNALVISDYALYNLSYNGKDVEVTWENSSIRQWLNHTFIYDAFTAEQRSKIIESRIENKENPKYGTSGGDDTYDKVFLLSIAEVRKYFKNKESRIAYITPYLKETMLIEIERCWWWLRSPGDSEDKAALVADSGYLHPDGGYVFVGNFSVRPALKINLKNL